MTAANTSRHWIERWVDTPTRAFLTFVGAAIGLSMYISDQRAAHDSVLKLSIGIALIVTMWVAALLHPRNRELCTGIIAICAVAVLGLGLGGTMVPFIPIVLYTIYLVSAYSSRRWRTLWLGCTVVGCVVAVIVAGKEFARDPNFPEPSWYQYVTVVFFLWMTLGFFWLLGVQQRRAQLDRQALKDRAELSAVVERTRIAREMHDIVAHNLSAITAIADGARYAGQKNPQVAIDALGTIADTSRRALGQMRGLLSVLRDDAARSTNAVGVGALDGLFADAERSGLDVAVTGFGSIPEDLPQLTQSTLYRVVQEMLTNMLKHSEGKTGTLAADVDARRVRLISWNKAQETRSAPGFGLLGMGERVRALGGTMQVNDTDGFELVVELPR